MESLRDPRFLSASERGNFWIQKRVTNKEDKGEDKSDEWKGNSNLNSAYSSYRIQVLIN